MRSEDESEREGERGRVWGTGEGGKEGVSARVRGRK